MNKIYVQKVLNENNENLVDIGIIFIIAKNEKEARKELSMAYPEYYNKDSNIVVYSLKDDRVNALITTIDIL